MENWQQYQSYQLDLPASARAWVDHYEPSPLSWYEKFISLLIGSARNSRPATLERDRFLLECLAEQCAVQGVKFPKRIFIVDTHIPNAAYLPITHGFLATSNILQVLPPAQLRAVIGHEVGHAKTRGWLLGLTLLGGVLAGFLAQKCLPKRTYTETGDLESPASGSKSLRGLTTRFFQNGFVREIVEIYAVMAGISLVQRQFEADADRRGANYTSPQDLADALRTMERRGGEIIRDEKAGKLPSREAERVLSKVLSPIPDHPSIDSRIRKLERMTAERRAAAAQAPAFSR